MKTVQNNLNSHNLTLTGAVYVAQNGSLCRLLATTSFVCPSVRPFGRSFVRPSVCYQLLNAILRKRMNQFQCKLSQIFLRDNGINGRPRRSGIQKSRSQETEVMRRRRRNIGRCMYAQRPSSSDCRHPRRRPLSSSSVALDITPSPPAASLHVDLSQVLAVVRRGCLIGSLAVVTVV